MEYNNLKVLFTPIVYKRFKNKNLSRIERTGCWIIQPNVIGKNYIVYIKKLNFYISNCFGFIKDDKLIGKVKEQLSKCIMIDNNNWLIFPIKIFQEDRIMKIFIYDLYVYNSIFYTNINTYIRINLLKKLFKSIKYNVYYSSIDENIKILESVTNDFKNHFNNINSYKFFDGVILRLKDNPLESLEEKSNNLISNLICK